jgi:hypothetical protein
MTVNNELDRDVERTGRDLIFRYHHGISLEGLRKTKIVSVLAKLGAVCSKTKKEF